jgi:hypothetical protein
MRTYTAAPKASMLIESMRDIGYSLETALADIIDNSITAGASNIDLLVPPADAEARLGVIDNGEGMTEDELLNAMRPGSQNPLDGRNATDLGRFGLGLKTASFSQCRKLTVVTRQNGATSAAIWDLDFVAKKNKWLVQIPEDITSIPWVDRLKKKGTLVIWENLDRAVGLGKIQENLTQRISDACKHLELVFHRFLSKEYRKRSITIKVNERPLKPFDPFHSNHPATIVAPVEKIKVGGHEVTFQAFTLPHHRKVTPKEWEYYAGREGYIKNQGFYVYRERRLIISGTWFGLARQMDLTKLARVRIDMPNGLDAEWKIDVKKASAQPPPQVRDRLRRIIDTIGATSKRVYTERGRRLTADNRLPVWNRVQDKGEIIYRLNREHPVLLDFVERLPEDLRNDFKQVIELAGSTLPMDALFSDLSGSPEKVVGDEVADDTLNHTVITTVKALREKGVTDKDLYDILSLTEPFRTHLDRTEAFLSQILEKSAKND